MHVEFSLIRQARGGAGGSVARAPRWRELKINSLLNQQQHQRVGNVPSAAAHPVAYTRPFNLSNCWRNAARAARESRVKTNGFHARPPASLNIFYSQFCCTWAHFFALAGGCILSNCFFIYLFFIFLYHSFLV